MMTREWCSGLSAVCPHCRRRRGESNGNVEYMYLRGQTEGAKG